MIEVFGLMVVPVGLWVNWEELRKMLRGEEYCFVGIWPLLAFIVIAVVEISYLASSNGFASSDGATILEFIYMGILAWFGYEAVAKPRVKRKREA
jgi:hypothetical protein